nr:15953_t:CDS:2 [Entrophospora candida]
MLVVDMGGHGRALEVLQNSLHNRDIDNLDSKSRRGYLTCPYIWIWMTAHFTNDPTGLHNKWILLGELYNGARHSFGDAGKYCITNAPNAQTDDFVCGIRTNKDKTDEYVSEVHQCNLLKKRSVNQKIYMEKHENTAADDDILYCTLVENLSKRPFKDLDDCESRTKIPRTLLEQFQLR